VCGWWVGWGGGKLVEVAVPKQEAPEQDITRSESALSTPITISTSGSTTLDVVSETVSSFVVDLKSDLRLSV
jgi:hypothetical protein